jgi:hypothetical protein
MAIPQNQLSLTFRFNTRLFVFLTLGFIVFTVIGTVSHECGHYVAAKLMGFDAQMNYMSTWLVASDHRMTLKQSFWFTLGGPLQTMLTGTIGFLAVWLSIRSANELNFKQWLLVFLSLFWLRQPANFLLWQADYFLSGYLSRRGDEIKLSQSLGWPVWAIAFLTALVGFLVLLFIIFRVIPKTLRFTFIISGITGGVLGYLLWLVYFGKIIMP